MKVRPVLPQILICAVLCSWGACQTQTAPSAPSQPIQAKPVVVEVTGESVPIEATSASVTVLTRKEIEEAHAVNLAGLLDRVGFIHVAQNGSVGSFASVTIRGGKPNFTLVLLDGAPLNDITNILGGSVDLSGVSIDNIERIEIVRGPLSSIYGSEAVSGVINIITRSDAISSAEVIAEGGNFGTERVAVNARHSGRRSSFGLGGSFLNVGEQVKSDAFSLGDLFGSLRVEGTNKVLEGQVRYQHDQDSSFPMNGGGPELSILQIPEESHSSQIVLRAAFRHQVVPQWLYNLDVTWFRDGVRSNTPAILDRIPPTFQSVPADLERTEFQRAELRFSNQLSLSKKWTAHLTAGLKDEKGTDNGLLAATIPERFHLDRPQINAGAEVVYSTPRLAANAGTGIDKTSGFTAHPASRAGINLRLYGGRTTLRSTWGSSFQLPSIYALGNPIVGNPALKPEKNTGVDVGVEQKFVALQTRVSVTYFWNSFADLIDFSATQFRLVNRTQAHTQGVELQTNSTLFSKIQIGGDAAYLEWKLTGTPEPLRDQPHWEGGVNASWTPAKKLGLDVSTRWIGRRFDFQVPAPLIPSVGGFSTTSLGTVYAVSRRVSVYTRIDNLFNRRYHEFLGFPNPGIYSRVGVKYYFEGRPSGVHSQVQ
jgi:outer membrane cobalamin receptor